MLVPDNAVVISLNNPRTRHREQWVVDRHDHDMQVRLRVFLVQAVLCLARLQYRRTSAGQHGLSAA